LGDDNHKYLIILAYLKGIIISKRKTYLKNFKNIRYVKLIRFIKTEYISSISLKEQPPFHRYSLPSALCTPQNVLEWTTFVVD